MVEASVEVNEAKSAVLVQLSWLNTGVFKVKYDFQCALQALRESFPHGLDVFPPSLVPGKSATFVVRTAESGIEVARATCSGIVRRVVDGSI